MEESPLLDEDIHYILFFDATSNEVCPARPAATTMLRLAVSPV